MRVRVIGHLVENLSKQALGLRIIFILHGKDRVLIGNRRLARPRFLGHCQVLFRGVGVVSEPLETAHVIICFEIVRIRRQLLFELRDGFVRLAQASVGRTEVVVEPGLIGR